MCLKLLTGIQALNHFIKIYYWEVSEIWTSCETWHHNRTVIKSDVSTLTSLLQRPDRWPAWVTVNWVILLEWAGYSSCEGTKQPHTVMMVFWFSNCTSRGFFASICITFVFVPFCHVPAISWSFVPCLVLVCVLLVVCKSFSSFISHLNYLLFIVCIYL